MRRISNENPRIVTEEQIISPKTGWATFSATAAVLFAGCAKVVYDSNKCLFINTAARPAEFGFIPCSGDPLSVFANFASNYVSDLHKIPVSTIATVVFASLAAGYAVNAFCSMMPHKVVKITTKEAAPAA